jgi:hypothetical protein
MDPLSTELQDEQELIESVLQGKSDDVQRLVRKFPEAAGLASDIEDLKQGLCAIEDEEPPLHSGIFLKKQNASRIPGWISTLPSDWYLNPFVLCLGMVALLWFLYILIVFVLH